MKKRKNLLLILLFLCFCLQAQQKVLDEIFYYYSGEKIFLTECADKVLLKVKDVTDIAVLYSLIQQDQSVKIRESQIGRQAIPSSFIVLESVNNKSLSPGSLNKYRANPIVASAQPMLQYNTTILGLTDEFIVKLKSETSYEQLELKATENNCRIVEENKFVKGQFMISVSKESKLNALQLANLFYESGLFEFASPNFVWESRPHSNDLYFSNQWGLKNTGQDGGVDSVDIKIEGAWNVTQGKSGIRIAVIDNGVDLTHPDLAPNLVSGFDATGYGTGGGPLPYDGFGDHGTACAGIIAARKNNFLGVAGVSPDCKLIPVHIIYGFVTDQLFANAINWSWKNGADVISNSWGGGVYSDVIKNAIDSATDQGRGGLGCVVVFSAGNDNATVSYPANQYNVIAVGAVDRCGFRSGIIDSTRVFNSCDPWPSCPTCSPGSYYGDYLDVVAPGSNIPTTDLQGNNGYSLGDYTMSFGGTSAACPHVAGVTALMLSTNSGLSWWQIMQILCSTAQKTNDNYYSYQTITGRPHGSWNNEMGYGLVNAYAAVSAARAILPLPCADTSDMIDEAVIVGDVVIEDCIVNLENVYVSNGYDLTVRAETEINVNGTFDVYSGSELELNVMP